MVRVNDISSIVHSNRIGPLNFVRSLSLSLSLSLYKSVMDNGEKKKTHQESHRNLHPYRYPTHWFFLSFFFFFFSKNNSYVQKK